MSQEQLTHNVKREKRILDLERQLRVLRREVDHALGQIDEVLYLGAPMDVLEEAFINLKDVYDGEPPPPGDPAAELRMDPAYLRSVLRGHWLVSVGCDHEAGTDTPQCACCSIQFPAFKSVEEAVNAWADHVVEGIVNGEA